ncbi:MAG: ADP compounds hydrolase NudE, partial [Proteobacteria bacterium]
MKRKPRILRRKTVSRSRLFRVDAVDLRFDNGNERCFEQLVAEGLGGVVVAPIADDGSILLVEEYALRTGAHELGLVKGVIAPGESAE